MRAVAASIGEAWHNAGRKQNKQHTIDDMVAAAEYLNQQRYSSPRAPGGDRGTSAGGIAVGGAIVQHPELFVAAIDNVGMTDLLRFQISQGGAANVPEFGDVNEAEGFKYCTPSARTTTWWLGRNIPPYWASRVPTTRECRPGWWPK